MNFTGFAQTNPETKYEVLGVIGEGGYGTVTKCRDRVTGELVALKRLKDDRTSSQNFHRELEMLSYVKELHPDSFNLVKLVDFFDHDGCGSLAFEMLDVSAYHLWKRMKSFTLSQIRPMAKQLLTALHGLRCVGVMHTDVKPDNIMLVNQKERPFKVKLIDFGLARYSGEVLTGEVMQPISYRAPEVTLGLPLWEAVDMWGLACCLLRWFVRSTDFTGFSEFDFLIKIVRFFGVPPEKLLNAALFTSKYFVQENSKWRLKTLQEFKETTGMNPKMSLSKPSATNLEQLIKGSRGSVSNQEQRDVEQFHDLLSKMLKLDAEERITPSQALDHPFITMEHFTDGDDYMRNAHELMRVTEAEFGQSQRDANQDIAEMDLRVPKSVSYSSQDSIWDLEDNMVFIASPDDCSKSKSQKNVATKNCQGVSIVKGEDTVGVPLEVDVCKIKQDEPKLAMETDTETILQTLKKELPDCGEILEDIENLFQDGDATEAEISRLTQKASRNQLESPPGWKVPLT
ncbi:homeodomain-interacting protein kinase 3-like [Boleophthalmus pectinirostris]|uniref:homeodomain-interacting protein kinase 3-like n=1 Tax=Boleophthalmus pectinirostris TaxID=150288 RepID=UPI00242B74C7|nr:homeodomain-interacting protein kinase 3-like [Boleophthalmus pectinirostris]